MNAVLSGMASLLILVAVLQYRRTKQLSVATEARIGSTLQPLMMRQHLDFYWNAATLNARQATAFTFANTTLNGSGVVLKVTGGTAAPPSSGIRNTPVGC